MGKMIKEVKLIVVAIILPIITLIQIYQVRKNQSLRWKKLILLNPSNTTIIAYDVILRELGVRDIPTSEDYAFSLIELHWDIGSGKLNVNELKSVRFCLI